MERSTVQSFGIRKPKDCKMEVNEGKTAAENHTTSTVGKLR